MYLVQTFNRHLIVSCYSTTTTKYLGTWEDEMYIMEVNMSHLCHITWNLRASPLKCEEIDFEQFFVSPLHTHILSEICWFKNTSTDLDIKPLKWMQTMLCFIMLKGVSPSLIVQESVKIPLISSSPHHNRQLRNSWKSLEFLGTSP